MKIYKLKGKNKENHNWKASIYFGEMLVRAQDERRARILASKATGIAVERQLGFPIPASPWKLSECVDCDEVLDNKYEQIGEETILSPESLLST